MDKAGIVVLGGHVQALGILRILGRLGINGVIVDNTSKNISRHSTFCKASFVVPDKKLLSFLVQLGQSGKFEGWVIFPTNDFHVQLLSKEKIELERFFLVSTDRWDAIRLFYNKRLTYNLANELAVPIAKTLFPSAASDLSGMDLTFPCIIKPAVMYDFYKQVKSKVFVCNNPDELMANYHRALQYIPAEEIIVQEIIQGPGRNQFSACFLFLNGKNMLSLTACRMRQHPLDFGNATTYAEIVDLPELIETGERILRAAGYNGLCEVEFKKDDRDGVYKFLEVNTRTWKWHAIAEKAGVPFLSYFYNHLTGKSITPRTGQQPASFRHALTDWPVQLQLFFKGYDNAFRKQKPLVKAVWAKDDIKPWVFEKLYLFYLLKSR
jgi:D-aspartate ligase